MTHDAVIRGATGVTVSGTTPCSIGIAGGRIARLGTGLDRVEVIDATGQIALPGGTDRHVPMAQPSGPGMVLADDVASGTSAAACGGNTTFRPFCLPEDGATRRLIVKAPEPAGRSESRHRLHVVRGARRQRLARADHPARRHHDAGSCTRAGRRRTSPVACRRGMLR